MKHDIFSRSAVTLIELLLAITLLGVLILYFTALQQIGHHDVITLGRRTKAQNQAIFTLEHISKTLLQVVGNSAMVIDQGGPTSINPIYLRKQGSARKVKFVYDANQNGTWDDIAGGDAKGCYRAREGGSDDLRFDATTGGNYTGGACVGGGGELIADNIVDFTVTPDPLQDSPNNLTQNWIEISITACYDATETIGTCGSDLNPQVTVSSRMKMPMVSVR